MIMVNIKNILLVTVLMSVFMYADMKCEAGKCGGAMSSDMKQSSKTISKNDNSYVYKGNTEHKAIEIKSKEYLCSKCSMKVKTLEYAAQSIDKEGNTYFFDDIGCLVQWLEKNPSSGVALFTQTLDTHKWLDAKKVWYSRIAPSPMGYGFGAVEHKKDALISYDEMKELMLEGKNLRNPAIKKSLLGN